MAVHCGATMRIVDLTVAIGPDTLSPPSVNKRLTLNSQYRGPGFWRASSVDMVLHTGSHVDFSLHVKPDGETAADVTLDRICGEALVLDMSHLQADEPITLAAVQARADGVCPGNIVLIRTDWTEKMWGHFPDYYLHSPYCAPETADWLVNERHVRAIGFDCFSEYCARLPDFTSEEFIIHKIILENGAILMQQMTNLSQLPLDRHFQFFAPCIKMVGAEGSPARFFALLDD
jgi:arylformamidase